MTSRRLVLSGLLLVAVLPPLQAQVADSSLFRALDLPAPNGYRTSSGRPGPSYWQQRADYRIEATLDPGTNQLQGRETIRYSNNSPTALSYLWLFLEQNMCENGSVTNQLDQPPLVFLGSTFDFSCQGFSGGITLQQVRVAGSDVTPRVFGTTMRLDLAAPLVPGGTVDLDLTWRFPVPDYGGGRMGHDGTLFEFGQWYPRMVVDRKSTRLNSSHRL